MRYETEILCPDPNHHGTRMVKVDINGVTADVCDAGCVFLNPGELDKLMSAGVASHGGHYTPMPATHGRRIRNHQGYFGSVFGGRGRHGHGSHSDGFFGSPFSFGASSGHYGHGS